MNERIFISYKREDKDVVFKIKDDIESNVGVKCWIDLDGIESDAQFVNVIIKAIDEADVFLFMYSKKHVEITDFENDWTIREINYAQIKRKKIIFLNIGSTSLSDWFVMMFGLKQQVDVNSSSAMNRLYTVLRKWLDVKSDAIIDVKLKSFRVGVEREPKIKKHESNISKKYKYDVFISSKSEDYSIAEKIYDFLISNKYSVFLASKELEKLGEAQYSLAIDEALDNTHHMIVVASSLNNIQSRWVQYEWRTFSDDLKSGYKEGNLLTIIDASVVKLSDLPASLRHQQSFNFNEWQNFILGYLPKSDLNSDSFKGDVQYKIRVNRACWLYLDDEKIQQLEANKITKILLSEGEYLRRVEAIDNKDVYEEKELILSGTSKLDNVVLDCRDLSKTLKSNINIEGDEFEKTKKEDATDLVFNVNGVQFSMKRVEGGTFTMGATSEQGRDACSDENPAHSVTLDSYYIGVTEVTQALWQAVMGSNLSYTKGNSLPVNNVSWDDCQQFIQKLNQLTDKTFSLPTEAQWEFAARGGNLSQGYKYAGSNILDEVAWYSGNSNGKTHLVAQKKPNELGLYDMSGNVWEWCEDWYGSCSEVPDIQYNPKGPSSGHLRVCRGGSFNYLAQYCRVFYRGAYSDIHYQNLGLRLVLDTHVKSNV